MSLTSHRPVQEATPHTAASWREQTPKARLTYLSLLLSQPVFRKAAKYHTQEEPDFLRRETLHNVRTCIPHLREHGVANPQGELVTGCHHGGVVELTEDGASTLQYVHPQRGGIPFKSHLALLTQYMVGRFDNSTQIAREKASGGQRTAYAIHVNNVIDERIEGGPRDGVVHILEETYKYAPGERTPQIAPLILRFEEVDGTIALSSMKAPDYVDKTALRNDNPCLWFGKGELKVSPSFPERQIYRFDESKMEFVLDVEVRISETTRFHLSEILARDRLLVSEKLWIGEKLKTGFYEDPFIYDRL